jgi:phage terminase small subunit
MRKVGRPSRNAHVQPIDGGAQRPLQPPAELSEEELESFASIVSTVKAGHFRPSDARLVALYVQSLTLARRTGERLAAELATPALLKAYDAATRRTCSLATKLRLTPQSRSPQKSARSNDAPRNASYYDVAASGGGFGS